MDYIPMKALAWHISETYLHLRKMFCGKRTKWDSQASKFQNFSGVECPWTPLETRNFEKFVGSWFKSPPPPPPPPQTLPLSLIGISESRGISGIWQIGAWKRDALIWASGQCRRICFKLESRSAWRSQSIKIGSDLSIDKSIKISKFDLIDIDFIHQSVEINDTHSFYRFSWFMPIVIDF